MSSPLRPYQEEAIRNALSTLESGRSTLLVLATGLGKTVIFSFIAKEYVGERGVLILESAQELVEQTALQVQRWTGLTVGIEMGERSCAGRIGRPPIVVASVPSLCQPARLEEYEPEAFSLVIVDEAHHALSSSHRAILDHFSSAKVLGVTATPDRHDRQALGQVFETVPFSFTIEDGIRGGWLAPVRQMRVVVESLDFSKVRSTTAGDLNEQDLERILLEEQHLHAVAAPTLQHAGNRRTLVFATSVAHAHQLAKVMNRLRPESAEAIDGTASHELRRTVLRQFRSGERQFLVNCGMYLEGFDEPSISCVAVARPTESRALYSQMVGRGTRLSPETGKSDLLVLDFVGNAGKHQLVSALDILGGEIDPRVRAAAQLAADGGVPVLDALAQARAQVDAEEVRLRERALDEEQRRGVVGKVHSRLEEISTGFVFYGFDPKTTPRNGADMSDKQRSALRSFGFTDAQLAGLDRAQASALLEKAIARITGHLCSQKQARFLATHGIDARKMTFLGAKRVIAAIAKNGWKAPPRGSRPAEGWH